MARKLGGGNITTVETLELIKKFLEENVCKDIKLKKPNDSNVNEFDLINPNVFIINLPPKDNLPEGVESEKPCLLVTFQYGLDDNLTAVLLIKIIAIVYNPGLHEKNEDGQVVCIPDEDGWVDLVNLLDKIRAELMKSRIINGNTIQYPLKWGVYRKKEQCTEQDPYLYGWIKFSVKNQSYPASEIDKTLI